MILDGKALARRIQGELKAETAAFVQQTGVRPCLATVLVGEDPASAVYVGRKRKACERIGYESRHHQLAAGTSPDRLLGLIDELNADRTVHGILVQLPLPPGLDSAAVIARIDPAKDVDGLHALNLGRLAQRQPGFVPCTPAGVMELLAESGVDPSGKRATVVGRSAIVGTPAALLLTHANATVTVVHSRTRQQDLEVAVRGAEILVVAVGRPGFVPGHWVREGAVVVDVGINRLDPDQGEERGRLVGDVDFEGAVGRAAAITPVPGGVGPMTITMLMRNTLLAARRAA
jgi:methylenetetrahydrofolate dehydrogenase (NADP+)/methenyltetrahydrofolate cyclohydrolase